MAPDGSIIDRVNVNVWTQDQLRPDLAFDGNRYVVAWGDRRAGLEQIHYTLVTGNGVVLNPVGRRLSGQDSTEYQSQPVLASNGDNYFLAWMGGATIGTVINGVRLGLDGSVLDSVPIRFTSDTLFENHIAVGTDGRDYLVVWCGETPGMPGDDLLCCRVSSAGAVLDSVPVLICRTEQGLSDPAVEFLDDRYLVTWTDMRDWFDVYGCRVMGDGVVLDPGGFAVCARENLQRESDVVTDGERFMVVWSDNSGGNFDIYAALVDTGSTVGLDGAATASPDRAVAALVALPNPAWGLVSFEIGPREHAPQIGVFDAVGRLIRRLPVGELAWDRRDLKGKPVPAGVYVARMESGSAGAGCSFLLLD